VHGEEDYCETGGFRRATDGVMDDERVHGESLGKKTIWHSRDSVNQKYRKSEMRFERDLWTSFQIYISWHRC